ncbi:hypothetical protein [Aeromicrobium sp. P5_D10]
MSPTVERSGPNRLPVSPQEQSRATSILTGLAALIGTLAIAVGVPVALLAAFGPPWPDEAPSAEWLSAPATGETVLAVLAFVVWLAWAHFMVCLVVEFVAERRQSGLAPHIPGGGIGTQGLARRLVASIVLLAAVTGAGMSSATAVTASEQAPTQTSTSQAPVATTTEVSLPDELPDGTLPTVKDLESATKTDVAEGVTTYYDVKPPNGRHYDTLWDISERYLGDGRRYKEVWDLNKGVTQPDGRILEKADLIHPGWVLKLPNDATGSGLKVVDHAELRQVPVRGGGSGGGAEAESTATDVAPASADTAEAGSGISIDDRWAPFFGVAAGLALAGVFLGLRRRRASAPSTAWWSTREATGTDPHDPDPQPPSPGTRLREEADVSTASWLDRAVRSLNSAVGAPVPARVSLGEGGVALAFDEEPTVRPPAGWQAHATVWTLDRETQVSGTGLSSLPGLVSIGRRDDGTVMLLDPESVSGVIALDGDSDVSRGLALSIAVDTATHPWADDRVVTLVGFADDLSVIGDGAIRHADDLGRVLESLDNIARYHRSACREAGVGSVREARAASPEAIDWSYHLVVCSGVPDKAELARLSALAADPAVALGVVIVGAAGAEGVRLTARPDGRVSSPLQGVDVTAQVLTVEAARSLTALHEPAAASRRVSMDQLVDVLESEHRVATAHDTVARVNILGPVTVDAPGEVEPDRRGLLTEIACFLALHPSGVHANRISAAIWPRGVDETLRSSALGQLSSWFGTTADGHPVVEQDAGIWRLAPGAVDLDWVTFRAALNRASEDGARRETHLRAALDLVSGPAFADVPEGRFGWLESMTVEGDIAIAVNLTVQAVAEAAAARNDEAAARGALVQGLAMLPASEELWRSRLRLAAHFGERADVESVAGEMYAAIAEHGSFGGTSGETDALVDELAPGYRSKVA